MINPINLNKLDEISGKEGKTFHVGQLPPYEQLDYDLSSPKDLEKFIKDVESEVRNSYEYRQLIKYLREYGGMDRSGINPNISNTDSTKIKIEIHHTPLTLGDIVRVVYEKRLFFHEDLSLEMVAKEVMECHYKCLIGLYPLTATEHEMVHNGYLFIPPQNVYGNWRTFVDLYRQFFDDSNLETLESIEEHGKDFDTNEQNKILAQSNIYIDPNGAYETPRLETLQNLRLGMSDRVNEIKNNMYMLPTLQEVYAIQTPKELPKAIYFVDDEGNIIDDPAE